jgi:hypothetical protein
MDTKLSRAVIAVVLFAVAGIAGANELELVSVRETGPGGVIARISLHGSGVPDKAALRLMFADKRAFPAVDVTPVAATPSDTQIAVLVDRSGSMKQGAIKELKDSLKRVAATANLQRKLTLIAFGTRTSTLSALSDDPAQFVHAVDAFKRDAAPDGRTVLYEAISGALMSLNASRIAGPKRVVVITDGKDEGSRVREEDIVHQAKAFAIPVNTIGFGDLTAASSDSLKLLADVTAGEFVVAGNARELSDALERLLRPASADPAFDVAFRYPPAPGGQSVTNAVLEFSPNGRDAVQQALGKPVAAPQMTEARATDPRTETGPGSSKGWEITIFKIDIDYRIVLALLGGTVVLVMGGIVYRQRHAVVVVRTATPPPATVLPATRKRRGTAVGALFPVPQTGRPAAVLVCQSGPAKGKRYAIDQTLIRIGADAQNDLRLTGDDYVSGEHASIRFEMGSLYLSDRNSRNGTFLNGTRLSRTAATLSPGDQIKIGRTVFELQMAQGSAEQTFDGTEPVVP